MAIQTVVRKVQVLNSLGIHSPSSAKVVACAGRYSSRATGCIENVKADLKSVLSVMMLRAACGSYITIEACGEDADECAEGIAKLIETGFFRMDCRHQLERYVELTKEADPNKLIAAVFNTKDAEYWYTRSDVGIAARDLAQQLVWCVSYDPKNVGTLESRRNAFVEGVTSQLKTFKR